MTKKKVEKTVPNVKAGEPDPLDIKKEEVKKDTSKKAPQSFKKFSPSRSQMNFIALLSVIVGSLKGLTFMFYSITGLILIHYTLQDIQQQSLSEILLMMLESFRNFLFFQKHHINKLEDKLSDKQEELRLEKEKFERKYKNQDTLIETMKKENEKLNKDGKASYKQEIDQMDKRFQKQNISLQENKEQIKETQVTLKQTMAEKQNEQQKNRELQSQNDQLKKQVNSLKHEVDANEKENTKKDREIKTLQNEQAKQLDDFEFKLKKAYEDAQKKYQLNQDKQECMICNENLEFDRYHKQKQGRFIMGCTHNEFHKDCIYTWLEKSAKCPYCNAAAKVNKQALD